MGSQFPISIFLKQLTNKWFEFCLIQLEEESNHVGRNQQGHGEELHKPFGKNIMMSHAPDVGHGAIGLVYPAGFWVYFVPLSYLYAPIFPFWNANVYFVPLYIGNMQFSSDLHRGSQLRVFLESQRRLRSCIFEQCQNC